MRRAWLPVFALAVAWTVPALTASGQDTPRVQTPAGLTVRGKIVRMEAPDQFIVRTSDNKEVIFFTNPQTRYTIDGRAGRYADLRVGTAISTGYIVRDDRNWVNTVTVGAAVQEPAPAQRPAPVQDPASAPNPTPAQNPAPAQVTETTLIRGRIVSMRAPDTIVVRSSDGKEITLLASPQTRYMINGKASQFGDLRAGAEINANFILRDGRHHVSVVTIGGSTEAIPVPAPNTTTTTTPEPVTVQGTIVRVVGEDQVVVKTAENKEVIIYVQPQTKYVFDDRVVRFSDLRTGSDIRVQYDVRDRRPIARTIFGLRRN